MKVLLLVGKHQGKEIECVSLPLTTPPCGASSPSKVIDRLMPLCTGKGQCRGGPQFGRAPEGPKVPSPCDPRCWHRSPCPFQGGHPFSHSVHWLHSAAQRRVELFLPFSGKELSRGRQDQLLLFTEVLTVTCPCMGHRRKNQTLLPHLWEMQVPICLLAFYIVVHSIWDQNKQWFWPNTSWSPSIDFCHSPIASIRITPFIIISL